MGELHRLVGHDYGCRGFYFVTFNTKDRRKILSRIVDGQVIYLAIGLSCEANILRVSELFSNIVIDSYVIMPDHIHLLIEIKEDSEETILDLLRWLKSAVTHEARRAGLRAALWQRGYHDSIIRDASGVERVRRYIEQNPAKW